MDYWNSWFDIEKLKTIAKLFLWAIGGLASKSFRKIIPSVIIDNNPKYHGTNYNGVRIFGRDYCSDAFEKAICCCNSRNFDEIVITELMEHGFVAGTGFLCKFQDYKALESIKSHPTSFLL